MSERKVLAPMACTVVEIGVVAIGQAVRAGQTLLVVVEAMKMEHEVRSADVDARVVEVVVGGRGDWWGKGIC